MVQCTSSLESITSEKLQGFFVSWPNPPSPVTHLKLLSHSDEIILALDNESGRSGA